MPARRRRRRRHRRRRSRSRSRSRSHQPRSRGGLCFSLGAAGSRRLWSSPLPRNCHRSSSIWLQLPLCRQALLRRGCLPQTLLQGYRPLNLQQQTHHRLSRCRSARSRCQWLRPRAPLPYHLPHRMGCPPPCSPLLAQLLRPRLRWCRRPSTPPPLRSRHRLLQAWHSLLKWPPWRRRRRRWLTTSTQQWKLFLNRQPQRRGWVPRSGQATMTRRMCRIGQARAGCSGLLPQASSLGEEGNCPPEACCLRPLTKL